MRLVCVRRIAEEMNVFGEVWVGQAEDGGVPFGPTPADVILSGVPIGVGTESKNLKRQSYRH